MEPPEGVWRELLIRVQRVRDTWAYDQTEEDRWTKIADRIKARKTLLWHNVHMPDENILSCAMPIRREPTSPRSKTT
jgi:hypothetical protein